MITIEVNGVRFEGFENISVSKNIETISGSFLFSATSDDVTTFPIQRSAPCKVFINDESVIDGFVDTIQVSYDMNSHSLEIAGRDKTSDIIDSTVVGKKEFVAPIGFEQIIRSTLDDNGLSGIAIVNEAGTISDFQSGEFVSSSIGQTVFEFLEEYARKRQVLLTTNGNGDVVIARSGSTQTITALENKINGDFNNIKSGVINYNDNNRFNTYIVQSQQNPSALSFGADVTMTNISSQKGQATDTEIRATRQLELTSNTSDSSVDLTNLAVWNANLRRARSADYSVVVQGYHQDEAQTRLWKPNELVKVADDFADVDATLLIRSVEYNLTINGGSTTTINLVAQDAYTLQASIDESESRANEQGENLTFSIL